MSISNNKDQVFCIISRIAELCDNALADEKGLASSVFATSDEARALRSACQKGDADEIVEQLRNFHGNSKPGKLATSLEATVRAGYIEPARRARRAAPATAIIGHGCVAVPVELLTLLGRHRRELNAALVGCSAEALEAVNAGTREHQREGGRS